ncbi:hypothetical protein ABZ825_34305 [Streptomyces tauricus]|uniref:hypothetical protein n=1 Tax=Streptomyces tauricus TaxID=68274 RepID=UPI0033E278B6
MAALGVPFVDFVCGVGGSKTNINLTHRRIAPVRHDNQPVVYQRFTLIVNGACSPHVAHFHVSRLRPSSIFGSSPKFSSLQREILLLLGHESKLITNELPLLTDLLALALDRLKSEPSRTASKQRAYGCRYIAPLQRPHVTLPTSVPNSPRQTRSHRLTAPLCGPS